MKRRGAVKAVDDSKSETCLPKVQKKERRVARMEDKTDDVSVTRGREKRG